MGGYSGSFSLGCCLGSGSMSELRSVQSGWRPNHFGVCSHKFSQLGIFCRIISLILTLQRGLGLSMLGVRFRVRGRVYATATFLSHLDKKWQLKLEFGFGFVWSREGEGQVWWGNEAETSKPSLQSPRPDTYAWTLTFVLDTCTCTQPHAHLEHAHSYSSVCSIVQRLKQRATACNSKCLHNTRNFPGEWSFASTK